MSIYARMARCLAITPLAALALGCSDDAPAVGDDGSSSSTATPDDSSGSPTTLTPTTDTTAPTTDPTSEGSLDDSSSSVGVSDDCGNGDLDEGEQCDDGNFDEGDACHADCTFSFEVAWTNLHDGPASDFDNGNDVWIDAEGNAYVLGNEASPGDTALWLQQYLPDGREGWVYRYDGAAGGDDFGSAFAATDDGDFLIVGTTTTDASGYDILILRLDGATQAVEWEVTVDGSGSGAGDDDDDSGTGIAVLGDGVAVVGSVSVDDQERDIWVGRYDASGTEQWTATVDGAAHGFDFAQGVLPGGDGDVIVLGSEDQGDDPTIGIARVYGADGMLRDAASQDFDFYVSSGARDGDGNIVLVGYAEANNTGVDAEIRKYDPSFTELWSVSYDGSLDDDIADGVHIDGDGNVVVVGTTYRVNQQANALVAAWDADGNPLWSDSYNTADVDLGEQWYGVATDATGEVVVAGYATILGHQGDVLVRKYRPL
ncbi:MAG: hypothetical protein IAG13_29140 [Deltaproteobacteria bacterium]|nr:hypothetical protein [Nannocystaceae bacterium]